MLSRVARELEFLEEPLLTVFTLERQHARVHKRVGLEQTLLLESEETNGTRIRLVDVGRVAVRMVASERVLVHEPYAAEVAAKGFLRRRLVGRTHVAREVFSLRVGLPTVFKLTHRAGRRV
jgi:hypothetical protein